jgi:hypothetical protein
MLRQEERCTLESRNQQLVFLCGFAQVECDATRARAVVACVFAFEAFQVSKIRSKAKIQAKQTHHPLMLHPDQEDAIAHLIEKGITMATLLADEIEENFV